MSSPKLTNDATNYVLNTISEDGTNADAVLRRNALNAFFKATRIAYFANYNAPVARRHATTHHYHYQRCDKLKLTFYVRTFS